MRGRASGSAHGPLISEKLILSLVGNGLQELFQDEFENFMGIIISKRLKRNKKKMKGKTI